MLSASSWIAAAPPWMLQNHHVRRRWKGRNGFAEYILLDLGAANAIDVIALLGCQGIVGDSQINLSATTTTRIRVSSADPLGIAGDVYDSGEETGQINAAFGALVRILDAPVTGRYLRIDLLDHSATALLAGRLIVGQMQTFAFNFQYGWAFGYADLSRSRKSAGGQTFVDRDDRYRILNLAFPMVSKEDRYSFVDEIDRVCGTGRDIFFITDPQSARPDRDSVWGLMQDMSPPTQPYFDAFAKSYSVEERL